MSIKQVDRMLAKGLALVLAFSVSFAATAWAVTRARITDPTDGSTIATFDENKNGVFVSSITAGYLSGDGGGITGVGTADALTSNGANCPANQFNKGVDASGAAESCAALVDDDVPDTITVDLAGTATALAADPADCSAGEVAIGINASGVAQCAPIVNTGVSGSTSPIDSDALYDHNAAAGAHSAGIAGEAATATALAANGANCSAGQAPLGVDASGAVESCFDVYTETEGGTHAALVGSDEVHGATSTNVVSQIVARDGSGDFAAGTITAALSGNATTATGLAANGANCAAGEIALGVDASGAAESCYAPTAADVDAGTFPGASYTMTKICVNGACIYGVDSRADICAHSCTEHTASVQCIWFAGDGSQDIYKSSGTAAGGYIGVNSQTGPCL